MWFGRKLKSCVKTCHPEPEYASIPANQSNEDMSDAVSTPCEDERSDVVTASHLLGDIIDHIEYVQFPNGIGFRVVLTIAWSADILQCRIRTDGPFGDLERLPTKKLYGICANTRLHARSSRRVDIEIFDDNTLVAQGDIRSSITWKRVSAESVKLPIEPPQSTQCLLSL
jgi:hypothetical protein